MKRKGSQNLRKIKFIWYWWLVLEIKKNKVIPPATKLQGGILVSPCPPVRLQTNPMSYDNLSCVSQNLFKFYQLFTGEERRIPLFFDDFHFCRSRGIGLDMTENRIFYPMSYDNLSSVSQNVLKSYQQLTGEERRIPIIFDDFHFCRSRVIGLDMTENRIFTLCRMIT